MVWSRSGDWAPRGLVGEGRTLCHVGKAMATLAPPPSTPSPAAGAPEASTARKALWFAAGWICFAVGAVGAVLPGIPTTGPMILALACFARSSKRFHDWLFYHRIFGPPLQRWQRDRIIPLRAKVLAISMMAASMAYVGLLSPLPTWAVIVVAALVVTGMLFILRCPHQLSGRTSGPQ